MQRRVTARARFNDFLRGDTAEEGCERGEPSVVAGGKVVDDRIDGGELTFAKEAAARHGLAQSCLALCACAVLIEGVFGGAKARVHRPQPSRGVQACLEDTRSADRLLERLE